MKHINFLFLLLAGFLLSGCTMQSRPTAIAKNASEPIRVSPPDTDSSEPSMAADGEGNIYTVYVEHGTDKAADIFLQKFDGNMKAQGGPVRIDPNAGEAGAWRGDQPSVKAGADGKIYVGWNSQVQVADGAANNLMLSVSSDGGKTFAAPVKVNDDAAPASHGMHAMAVEGENVYFAWLDERYLHKEPSQHAPKNGEAMSHGQPEPNAELYFAVSKDGGKTFSANKKLAADICPCCKVTMLQAKGRLYLSWRQILAGDMRHIAVASSADGGENFAAPVIVSDDKWQLMVCPVSGAPLAVNNDGTLAVAWYTAGEAGVTGLYTAESKDGGRTFSPRVLVSEGAIVGTPIMFYNGGADIQILWAAGDRVLSNIISAGKTSAQKEMAEGELPAAVMTGAMTEKRLFISYIKKENGKRVIWLRKADN